MKPASPTSACPGGPAPSGFTLDEHLRVQREIEQRAHRRWLARNRAGESALDDWLRAEDEVLAAFVKQRSPRPAAARTTQTRTAGTAAVPPEIPPQTRFRFKSKPTAACLSSL